MKNLFKAGVEATRKEMEIIEAEKVAEKIKQYNGIDVYNLMKKGQMYAIVIDGVVVGGATSKKDAEEAVNFLKHFTNGDVLNKESLITAQMGAMKALRKANEFIEAEKDGIKIKETFNIEGNGYVVDDTDELYTEDGEHIDNIADVMSAMETGGLTKELGMEIIISRINEFLEENSNYDQEDNYDNDDEDYDL